MARNFNSTIREMKIDLPDQAVFSVGDCSELERRGFHRLRTVPTSAWCATDPYRAGAAFRSFREESRLFLTGGFDVGGRRDVDLPWEGGVVTIFGRTIMN